jgi:hypothetical protein
VIIVSYFNGDRHAAALAFVFTFQWPGVPVLEPVVFGGGTLEALPTPLGSLIELLLPPTLPGPGGIPLTLLLPAPADPAFGVPAGLVVPPALCANEATGAIAAAMMATATILDSADIGHSPDGMPDNKSA